MDLKVEVELEKDTEPEYCERESYDKEKNDEKKYEKQRDDRKDAVGKKVGDEQQEVEACSAQLLDEELVTTLHRDYTTNYPEIRDNLETTNILILRTGLSKLVLSHLHLELDIPSYAYDGGEIAAAAVAEYLLTLRKELPKSVLNHLRLEQNILIGGHGGETVAAAVA
ncbi:uncharacterized protein DFL_009854 [Arthrobotrys flagrans]|uniref:Uncharacterized protein n=1 Tax=Arthrobotrys flagrans TaxID=97331 RepID=A0A436ZST4_ARTFL|nr:hypothetical protein DFL_009854 [Arthrobotrys flagrans]